jgi:hypothetical protein
VAALRRADPPSTGPTGCVKEQETEKPAKAQQRAIEPWMDGWVVGWKETKQTHTVQSKDKTSQQRALFRQQQEFNKCNHADHYATRKNI